MVSIYPALLTIASAERRPPPGPPPAAPPRLWQVDGMLPLLSQPGQGLQAGRSGRHRSWPGIVRTREQAPPQGAPAHTPPDAPPGRAGRRCPGRGSAPAGAGGRRAPPARASNCWVRATLSYFPPVSSASSSPARRLRAGENRAWSPLWACSRAARAAPRASYSARRRSVSLLDGLPPGLKGLPVARGTSAPPGPWPGRCAAGRALPPPRSAGRGLGRVKAGLHVRPAGDLLGPGQAVGQGSGPLQLYPGGGQALVQVQRPGEGSGSAEGVRHRGGEGVHRAPAASGGSPRPGRCARPGPAPPPPAFWPPPPPLRASR